MALAQALRCSPSFASRIPTENPSAPAAKLVSFPLSSSVLRNEPRSSPSSQRSLSLQMQVQMQRPRSLRTFVSHKTEGESSNNDVQKLHVYEINERDRGSPAYLRLSQKSINSLGDLVPFSNKVYHGNLQKRLGITAGICILIKHNAERNGDRYEAIFSVHLGDYGHIAVQGAYLTYEDTYLAVTGGSGIFEGVTGQVKLQQLIFPFKLFYTFFLRGIDKLPEELLGDPVPPSPTVEPSPAARAADPSAAITNFTD